MDITHAFAIAGIPGWLGVLGTILVIAATLGAAVAVYRTSLQSTSLREAERTIERLRGEIGDYDRREDELKHRCELLEKDRDSNSQRIKVMEDLLTRRQDDEALRLQIAAAQRMVLDAIAALGAEVAYLTGPKKEEEKS